MNNYSKDFYERKDYVTSNSNKTNMDENINNGALYYDEMREKLNEISQVSNGVIGSSMTARNGIISSSMSRSSSVNNYGKCNNNKTTTTVKVVNNPQSHMLNDMRTLNNNRF